MNDNLLLLDTAVGLLIKATGFNAPPDLVADGDVFLVGSNPTGPWLGNAGKITVQFEGAWAFFTPKRGWRARIDSLGGFFWYNGQSWISEATGTDITDPAAPSDRPTFFDVAVTVVDPIRDNEVVVHLPLTGAVILPANMFGSVFDALVAPTGNATLRVFRNATQVGQVTIGAGQISASFSTTNGQAVLFQVGDRLTIRGPVLSVPTLRDFGLVIRLSVV